MDKRDIKPGEFTVMQPGMKYKRIRNILVTHVMPTYNKQCGIGEYSKKLFETIKLRSDEEITFDIYPSNDLQSLDHYLKYKKPDIIHIHHEFSFFQSSKALGDVLKDFKGKSYITLHTLLHDNSKFNEEVANSVTKVIVHSKKWLDKVPNSIHIPMCCHDRDMPLYANQFLEEKNKIKDFFEDSFVIATNGFIRRQKGFEKLLYTLKIMREKGVNTKLLILGPKHFSHNDYEEKLISNIEHEDMEDHVLILRNFFHDQTKMAILSKADIIVYPYNNAGMIGAGCSASIKDNLCLGVPIIVSNCSSFTDMGREVYRIENNDPDTIVKGIQWVMNNDHVRNKLIQRAKKRSQKDSWENIAKMHMQLYGLIQKNDLQYTVT